MSLHTRESMGSVDYLVTSSTDEESEACLDALVFSNSIVFPMVLNTAIELDLFSIIAKEGPGARVSASEIASRLPTQNPEAPSMVDRMLRLLVSHSLLTCSLRTLEDGRVERLYSLTPASRLLILQISDGVSLSCLSALTHHPAVLQSWLHLKDVILEGGEDDMFKKVHGMSQFEFMSNDPTYNNIFNKAMAGMSQLIMRGILDVYRGYKGLASLVDVGGGTGRCLNMIVSKYPSIKGINFDLPHVTQSAPSYPGIEHVGGDMFESVPTADAIMIKDTCHNWSDENCIKLLKNCYKALPVNGKLIIINVILLEEPDSSKASMYVSGLDNIMFMQPSGKERTVKEFETLCKIAGFSNFQVVCVGHGVRAVMESYK
ncbi:hypothetical protein Pint_29899 [Pistacia integerrima]|uniref:Uncharacterized protein n=1 Tax=Pistacia integerrima TaxID=434235 RepID=A0ACC0X1E2_9ROSI|nr:hypothetical protein Pint_29899 [Pistacia integerrima]